MENLVKRRRDKTVRYDHEDTVASSFETVST